MKDVHVTDLTTKVGCPQRWDWESLLRRGLQRTVIPMPLFIGQGVHVGLNAYYVSNGNIYTTAATFRQWVLHRADAIKKFSGALWDSEVDKINDAYNLGLGMLKHYHLWAPKRDVQYNILGNEQKFTVPIPVPRGAPKDSRDRFDVHAGRWLSGRIQLSGRFDGLIQDKSSGDIYLLEFKTARSLKTSSWTFRGLQGTAYVYAAQCLYGVKLKGIMYRILRKQVPSNPLPLQRGGYSQKQKQKTSLEHFKQCLDKEASGRGIDPHQLYKENEKVLRELHGRRTSEGNDFFMERIIHKSPELIDNAMRTIYYEGLKMADPNVPIYATPGWWRCNNCPFRDPCDLVELGMSEQAEALLDAEYAPRGYWEEPDENKSAVKTNGFGTEAA